MTESPRTYVPAAGRHWALPLYDPFNRLIGIDRLRKALLEQATLRPGHRFELLDFRGPEEGARFIARLFHSHDRLQDNAEGRVLSLATDAGLADARCVGDRRFLLGRVGYYQASRAV